MQYQHDIILHCCYFAAKLVIKTTVLPLISFDAEILFSNFQNNEYDVMIERDVIFHTPSGAIDVIKVDVM